MKPSKKEILQAAYVTCRMPCNVPEEVILAFATWLMNSDKVPSLVVQSE